MSGSRGREACRIAVLMSNVHDAHQRRLVRALERHGHAITAVGFARDDYYRKSSPVASEPGVLGVLANESYAARFPAYLASLGRLRKALRAADVIVAFSSEHVLLARAATAGRRPAPLVVRELADIPRAVDDSGLKARLARRVERAGVRRSSAVAVTAEGFRDEYLRGRLGFAGPVVVLPNKPDLPPRDATSWRAPAPGEPLEILYAGLLRCSRSLEVLRLAAEAAPSGVRVSIRGHNLTGATIEERENFRYEGPYRSPEDLAALYEGCHVAYSAYPYEPARTNYALARTNRFYEAVFFGRPQINHAGTADGRAVAEQGLGLVIDARDAAAAARRIVETPVETWSRFAENAGRTADAWTSFDEDFEAALKTFADAVADR